MLEYLKKVLQLVYPYRFRFALGLFCGFVSGMLAMTLPLSLKVALDAVFPEDQPAAAFSAKDIRDLPGFVKKLRLKSDDVSAFLNNKIDLATLEMLAAYQDADAAPELRAALARVLNQAIAGPSLYETNRFESVTLRPETQGLLAQNPKGKNLRELNRLLIEDAYARELPARPYAGKQKLSFLPPPVRKLMEKADTWFTPSDTPSMLRKVLAISLIPAAMFLRGMLAYLNAYMLHWVSIRAANDLRVRIFEHVLHLPMGFFGKTSTGDLMARIEGATGVMNTINGTFATLVRDPIQIIVLVITLISMNWRLSLATLVVFPLCLVPVTVYGRKLRRSHTGIHSKFANAANVLHEAFTGVRVIKAYNLEHMVVDQFRSAAKGITSFFMRSVRASELPGPLIEFLGSIGVALIFVYFAVQPAGAPRGSTSDLLVFFMAVFNLYAPFKNLSRVQSQVMVARAGAEPAYDLLSIQSTLPEPAQPKPLRAQGVPIRFENISFSYGERTILHDINLTIQPGQLVALVGRTGSGKTSLANLLLRFYDPQQGAVLIGDTDIRTVSSRDLRANIAVVTQDTILFNTTIGHNIELGRPGATKEEIEEAARHAYAHDFITQDKQYGYDTYVGEKGINVSGGQRQRIAIARAILRNAPILILDEATNSLDTESERIVQTALEELMQNRTTICIAHRLSTIQNADLIVVLDGGRIVDTGTHTELLKKGGIYSRLYELSFEPAGAV